MPNHPEALAHGELREVLPDVFVVSGESRAEFMGHAWRYSRNMTVVRQGSTLTLFNTVRLDEPGLSVLETLGRVSHVVRLGAFHGRDDAFYVGRYGARLWALRGMDHGPELRAHHELEVDGAPPIDGASVFSFRTSARPEAIVRLERGAGLLISCDSLQNWVGPDEFFDEETSERMQKLGFFGEANVGVGWRLGCDPQRADFVRLQALPYEHLLSAHGAPLLSRAKARVDATLKTLGLLPVSA